MLDDKGKPAYAPVVDFVEPKIRDKWSAEAVAAIDEFTSKEPATGAGSMNGGKASEAADQGRRDG